MATIEAAPPTKEDPWSLTHDTRKCKITMELPQDGGDPKELRNNKGYCQNYSKVEVVKTYGTRCFVDGKDSENLDNYYEAVYPCCWAKPKNHKYTGEKVRPKGRKANSKNRVPQDASSYEKEFLEDLFRGMARSGMCQDLNSLGKGEQLTIVRKVFKNPNKGTSTAQDLIDYTYQDQFIALPQNPYDDEQVEQYFEKLRSSLQGESPDGQRLKLLLALYHSTTTYPAWELEGKNSFVLSFEEFYRSTIPEGKTGSPLFDTDLDGLDDSVDPSPLTPQSIDDKVEEYGIPAWQPGERLLRASQSKLESENIKSYETLKLINKLNSTSGSELGEAIYKAYSEERKNYSDDVMATFIAKIIYFLELSHNPDIEAPLLRIIIEEEANFTGYPLSRSPETKIKDIIQLINLENQLAPHNYNAWTSAYSATIKRYFDDNNKFIVSLIENLTEEEHSQEEFTERLEILERLLSSPGNWAPINAVIDLSSVRVALSIQNRKTLDRIIEKILQWYQVRPEDLIDRLHIISIIKLGDLSLFQNKGWRPFFNAVLDHYRDTITHHHKIHLEEDLVECDKKRLSYVLEALKAIGDKRTYNTEVREAKKILKKRIRNSRSDPNLSKDEPKAGLKRIKRTARQI